MSEALSCPSNETPTPGCHLKTLYWACAHNDPDELQARLDVGVSPEEVSQVDSNGRVRYPRAQRGSWGRVRPHPQHPGLVLRRVPEAVPTLDG